LVVKKFLVLRVDITTSKYTKFRHAGVKGTESVQLTYVLFVIIHTKMVYFQFSSGMLECFPL